MTKYKNQISKPNKMDDLINKNDQIIKNDHTQQGEDLNASHAD